MFSCCSSLFSKFGYTLKCDYIQPVKIIEKWSYIKDASFSAGNAEIDCLEDLGCVSSQTCDFEEDTCCYTSDPETGVAYWKRNTAKLLHIKDHTLSTEQGMNILCFDNSRI